MEGKIINKIRGRRGGGKKEVWKIEEFKFSVMRFVMRKEGKETEKLFPSL